MCLDTLRYLACSGSIQASSVMGIRAVLPGGEPGGGRMTFIAKTLAPLAGDQYAASGAFEEAADGGITLLEAPAGCLLTEGLALALRRLDRHPLWLRLGPEDQDPAAFLLSLVTAARRSARDAGEATLALMKERPGPVFGWAPLFAQLARDLRGPMSAAGALVLEDIHHAAADCPTLGMCGRYLLPELAEVAPCVLMSHPSRRGIPLDLLPRGSAGDLRLPRQAVRRLLEEWDPELTARARNRALGLIGGRASILAGLRELSATTGHRLAPLLDRVASTEELAARTAELLLADASQQDRCALGLAVRTEYTHPAMVAAVAGEGRLPPGPWLQRLEGDWVRIRPCWRQPLRAALGKRGLPGRDKVHQSADWLVRAGASERAVALYLEIGDHACAVQVIRNQADALLDLGQWATVHHWLARLPEELLAADPGLSCHRADLAVAYGDTATALRWFDIAAAQYAKSGDAEGECRSVLSGSAVAAEAGDLANSLTRASTARSLAITADLPAAQMWASWQLGRVELAAGDTEGALVSFCGAASFAAAGGTVAAGPVRAASDLAMRVRELREQQERHRQAQVALGHEEHDALNQLMATAQVPLEGHDEVFRGEGWSGAPAPLKFPMLMGLTAPLPDTRARPPIRARFPMLPLWKAASPGKDPGKDERATDGAWPRDTAPARGDPPSSPASGQPSTPHVPSGPPVAPGPPAVSRPPVAPGLPGPLPGTVRGSGPPMGVELAVHLLGPLYVAVDNVAVADWPSARCRSLFGYLVTHRAPWPSREVLMEAFWPGSSPDASRNSLNVAIHALRQTLRGATDVPVVVHGGGGYQISGELRLWLDTEEFDRHLESGRRHEAAGQFPEAMRDYEFAASLYRGDFMADDPYEDWTALIRERLRMAHLDALGRLSTMYFEAGQYTACASLCQRIIERDPCREDAHRRLMRCYSRQSLPHLALMQYRACQRALADELGVDADPATTELQRRIRRHERV